MLTALLLRLPKKGAKKNSFLVVVIILYLRQSLMLKNTGPYSTTFDLRKRYVLMKLSCAQQVSINDTNMVAGCVQYKHSSPLQDQLNR